MQVDQLKQLVLEALEDSKALDIKTLQVNELTEIADYMIIATGTSDRHVNAVATNVISHCRDNGRKPIGNEGDESVDKEWLLVDYGDIIVHVMRQQAREYYNLDQLWGEDMKNLIESQRQSN